MLDVDDNALMCLTQNKQTVIPTLRGMLVTLSTDPNDADDDADNVCDVVDNGPGRANTDQADNDSDGLGNVCDPCPDNNDADSDNICDETDNCIDTFNDNQQDTDTDGIGDACDTCPFDPGLDEDDDGVCGTNDNCPSDLTLIKPMPMVML